MYKVDKMRKGFSIAVTSFGLLFISPFSVASDFSDSEVNQICDVCEKCCMTNSVKVKRSSVGKKQKKKKAAQMSTASIKNKEKWIHASLYGSNISGSSLSPAKLLITSDNQHKVTIKTQFSFDCKLQFNNQGEPSTLSSCTSTDDDNKPQVKEKTIRLNCFSTDTSDTCQGEYTLLPSGDEESGEIHTMTIAKRRG